MWLDDYVSPSQNREPLRTRAMSSRMDLPPELKLIEAVFYGAITEGDLDWINDRRDDWVFSFVNCCAALDIDPSAARVRLNQTIKPRAKTPTVVTRKYTRRRLTIVDIPGHTYTHKYGSHKRPERCHQCWERYQYAYRRQSKDYGNYRRRIVLRKDKTAGHVKNWLDGNVDALRRAKGFARG